MIVTADPSRLGLAPGDEILRVNGVPAGALLGALLPYARADGHNDAKRVSLLEVQGRDRIEFFDAFHGLVFGAPQGGVHDLIVRSPDGGERPMRLPAIGLSARRAQTRAPDTAGADAVWGWSVRPDWIAVLSMPTWALYDSRWDWRRWLDERLDSLTGARGLVIDLRRNEGGQDCGDAILARLTDKAIVRPGADRRTRFQRTPADLDPNLDTWDDSFRTLGVGAQKMDDGFFRLGGARGADVVALVGPRLTVRAAALVGPVNSSATFQFAQKARATGLVRLFGGTTGGDQRGVNGGCFFFVRLPAGGIEFDLPLIGEFPPGAPPDMGIEPDVAAPTTAADIAAGRDPPLESAVRWLLG